MSALTCVRARLRLQERGAGLSAADALRLEDHLAGCDECRSQAVLLDRLRGVAEQLDGRLDSAARERAISGAFARVAQDSRRAPSPRPLQLAWGFAAFAAGAALFFALRSDEQPGREPQPVAHEPAANAALELASTDGRVLSGSIEVAGKVLQSGALLRAGDEALARGGAELALAHAQVSLRADTVVRWDGSMSELALSAGSVLAEVDPSKHARFSVRTPRFRAVVLGTRFEVTLEGVRVERGLVQVVDLEGRVLAPGLRAGQSFTREPAAANGETAVPPVRANPPSEPGEHSASAAKGTRPASALDVNALLQRARTSLAARDARAARRTVDEALALRPAQAVRAEALSLRAECARVGGDVAAAVTQYLQVADGFGRLPAAQNALFAAARLEAERGRRDRAAELFARYLARYPDGSLAEDAARRLGALAPQTKPRSDAKQ